ncbi:MAG: chloride channel protein [Akkermansiaceae bacterium]
MLWWPVPLTILFSRLKAALKLLLVLVPMGMVVGSASAFFIRALDAVTLFRFDQPWLLYLLPLAGLGVGLLYHLYGKSAAAGNNLLIDEIHEPGAGVPRRMAPLILLGTLVTHLFGGSAGREGTAVQMGGGIAATFARHLKLAPASVRLLLMAGVAAGFGSVFGTPVAGAVFALEVLIVGRLQYGALPACFFAAVVADWTCRAWGVGHTHYHVALPKTGYIPDPLLLGKVSLAAVAIGLASALFTKVSHRLGDLFRIHIPRPEFRPVVGGVLVIGLFFLAGTSDYLGLGVLAERPGAVTLPALFTSTEVPASAWAWKLAFTVVTLAAGFKGGEVTPLFFIGAALGNSLALVLGAPVDLFAAIGFVAIFAGATNTPIASTLLGMELFGAGNGIYLAAACIVAYHCSGSQGIYLSQRVRPPKFLAAENHK